MIVATLLVLTSLALVAGLLLHIARQQDERAADQASALVHAGIDRRREVVARDIKDYAAWGEAYQHLHLATDIDWAFTQRNLGATLYDDLGYDAVLVIGPTGRVTYAVVGGRLAPDLPEDLSGGGLPALVGAARAAAAGESKPAVGFLQGRDSPFLVAATVITPGGDGSITPRPGPASVLVFADRLTPERLDELGRQAFVHGLRASDAAGWTELPSSMALATAEGKTSVVFEWEPERPGTAILWAVLPWLLVATVAFALLVVVIMRRMLGAALVIERKSQALGEAHRQMEHAALHDPVTRLPNRVFLDRHLSRALGDPARSGGIAVVFIDLDRFKPINDTLGHRAGDLVLQVVADRLRGIPQPDEVVARIGGDEFVLALRRDRPGGSVEQLCEAVRDAVRAPIGIEGITVQVGLSLGVAFGPADGLSAAELLRHADVAMYAAKTRGGNRTAVFSPAMTYPVSTTALWDALAANGGTSPGGDAAGPRLRRAT